MQLNRRAARFFITLLAFSSFLPAIAQGADIRDTLKSDGSRITRAAASDCQRSFEQLKEKF
ncbi:hypothetical protein [Granulicella sp. S190]|uniref:hypothetical protein n=1 Tax=Granulicella sp. S190 TaxID=1747226 RepID=UPI00131E2AC8|nr:hypothetical protein [Granulicella sp. S190]